MNVLNIWEYLPTKTQRYKKTVTTQVSKKTIEKSEKKMKISKKVLSLHSLWKR
jgi:hypothetical protein